MEISSGYWCLRLTWLIQCDFMPYKMKWATLKMEGQPHMKKGKVAILGKPWQHVYSMVGIFSWIR